MIINTIFPSMISFPVSSGPFASDVKKLDAFPPVYPSLTPDAPPESDRKSPNGKNVWVVFTDVRSIVLHVPVRPSVCSSHCPSVGHSITPFPFSCPFFHLSGHLTVKGWSDPSMHLSVRLSVQDKMSDMETLWEKNCTFFSFQCLSQ